MKYALSCLMILAMATMATAQTRTFSAQSIVLDDNAGNKITITVPAGLSGSYTWPLPLTVSGVPSAYVAPGGSTGDLLRWDGSNWTPVSFVDAGTSNGDVLSWNGTKWVPVAGSSIVGTVAVANGGTGQTSYNDGELLIGNSSGNTLTKNTLTAGNGVQITNGNGTITIGATPASMLIGQTSGNVSTGGTVNLYCPSGQTNGGNTATGFKLSYARVTRDGIVKNLYVDLTVAPGLGNSHTFTVRNVTSGLELAPITISDLATSGNSGPATLAVSAGDILTVKHTATSGPTGSEAVWSFEVQ